MTPDRGKIHALIGVLALTGLVACAPTKPPVDQLNAAAGALETARSVGAGEFAAADLNAAAREYDAAQAAQARGDYDAAAHLAMQSQADGELAAARARRVQASQAVDKLTNANATLQSDLSSNPPTSAEDQP